MKKIALSLLTSNILINAVSPTVAFASEQPTSVISTLTSHNSSSEEKNYLRLENGDEIVTKIGTENLVEFRITEDGEEFDLVFNFEKGEVTVDDKVYNMEEYLSAINGEGSIKETVTLIEPLRFSQSEESALAPTLENSPNISIMAILPTTGYNPLVNYGTYRQINMKIGFATAALTAIAAFVFKGNAQLSQAFVSYALQRAVEAGIIASTTDYFFSDVYYIKRQATHPTAVGAVKETREPYTLIQNTRVYGSTATWYFWSVNPY